LPWVVDRWQSLIGVECLQLSSWARTRHINPRPESKDLVFLFSCGAGALVGVGW